MVMIVMLDLTFPFFRAWGWKSDEYGALINQQLLSVTETTEVKEKLTKGDWPSSSGTWMSLS